MRQENSPLSQSRPGKFSHSSTTNNKEAQLAAMNARAIVLLTALAGMIPIIAARAAEDGAGFVNTRQGTVTQDRGGQKFPAPAGTLVLVKGTFSVVAGVAD